MSVQLNKSKTCVHIANDIPNIIYVHVHMHAGKITEMHTHGWNYLTVINFAHIET